MLNERSKELTRAIKSALRAIICADVGSKSAPRAIFCADGRATSAPARFICADAHFQFLEFFYQHIFWPHIMHFVDGLYSDILNAGASISKLRLIFNHSDPKSHESFRMVASEIEYVFLTCRSMFDLLQQIMLK